MSKTHTHTAQELFLFFRISFLVAMGPIATKNQTKTRPWPKDSQKKIDKKFG